MIIITFKEKLSSRPSQLALKDCVCHSVQFFRFSKTLLRNKTKDWKYEPHKGMSIVDLVIYFVTFSVVFSFICTFAAYLPMLISSSYIGMDLIDHYEWIFIMEGILFGVVIGFVFTIEAELESVNKSLSLLYLKNKLERSEENGALAGLKEVCGLEYPDHVYLHDN